MESTLLIRPAAEKDMPAVHGLVYELAVYEREPEAVITTPEEYLEDFRNGLFECIVAEMDGEIVGMALYYMTYSTWKGKMLYLEDLYVKASHRRYGVGQQLLDAYLQEAQGRGCRLVKWQVLDWNEPAVRFYEKNKAVIEKGWWNVKMFFPENF